MTSYFLGAPDTIRTYGLWLRKPTLYPAELRVRICTHKQAEAIVA